MSEDPRRVFWRHRFERESGSFKFFCSSCHDRESTEPDSGLRLTEVTEDLLREYLRETGGREIACSGCGEILVRREAP